MINEILKDAEKRMKKSIDSLESALKKVRTGRAHPSILDGVVVPYYGVHTPLKQVANITIEDARTLVVTPWEKQLTGDIEKAILKSDLGLNPAATGDILRLPMPPLTEDTRREMTKIARQEAEAARVAIRNIRRDANSDAKELLKEKENSEDDERKAQDTIQKVTDKYVAAVEQVLKDKETELMAV